MYQKPYILFLQDKRTINEHHHYGGFWHSLWPRHYCSHFWQCMTSASIPISTKALGKRNAALENGRYLAVPGIVLLEGGLPIITKDGQHIGAIGISGANPELDGICAQAGLDAIAIDV